MRTTEATPRRDATRQRILDEAGRLFRQDGVDGVGVDAVMKAAGLTHGGFYAHFASKQALVDQVACTLLQRAEANWDAISRQHDRTQALARIVTPYLDADRVAAGTCCPLPTLGTDLARHASSRQAIGAALDGMIAALTRCMPGRRRQRALTTLSTLVGAVVLARLSDDPALSKAFLDAAADSLLPAVKPASSAAPP